MRRFYTLICIFFLFISSCAKHTHETSNEEGHSHEHSEDVITLHTEKAESAGVKTSEVHPTTIHQVIKTGGKILAALGDEETIVAKTRGIVTLNKQLVQGTKVTKGQPLLYISGRNIDSGDAAEKARITYELAKQEYERVLPLVEKQLVSQKDFLIVKQQYEEAKISFEAIGRGSSNQGTPIGSPLNGFVKELLINQGDFVEVGQVLATVTQNKKQYLQVQLSERYSSHLSLITTANFKQPNTNVTYQLAQLNGKLISYGKSVSETTYSIPLTFEFDNQTNIVPGSFVEVFLQSSPLKERLALPHSAITEEQGLFFVYKKVCKEEYEKIEVQLGIDNGELVEIVKGIEPGDLIVVEGALQIKLASASNAIPAHTHEH
mgnify:FL=1